jgi:hypothetical protein
VTCPAPPSPSAHAASPRGQAAAGEQRHQGDQGGVLGERAQRRRGSQDHERRAGQHPAIRRPRRPDGLALLRIPGQPQPGGVLGCDISEDGWVVTGPTAAPASP